jgi:hypothetical protein
MHYTNRLQQELLSATIASGREIADRIFAEAEADLKAVRERRNLLNALAAPIQASRHLEGETSTLKTSDVPASKRLTANTLAEAVIKVLEAEGDLTWAQLYNHFPDLRPGTVYQNVQSRLVTAGRVEIIKEVGSLDRVHLNPSWTPTEFQRDYVGALRDRDPSIVDPQDKVLIDFAEALRIYEEQVVWPRNGGKRLWANHTLKAVKNHGLIGAIKLMVNGEETSGFTGLSDIARDATAEAIVLRHPDRFDPFTIQNARKRLKIEEPTGSPL